MEKRKPVHDDGATIQALHNLEHSMPAIPTTMPARPSQTAAYGGAIPIKFSTLRNFKDHCVKLSASQRQRAFALVRLLNAVLEAAEHNNCDVGVKAVADGNGRMTGIALLIWPRPGGRKRDRDSGWDRATPGTDDRARQHRPHAAYHDAPRRAHADRNTGSHIPRNTNVPPHRNAAPAPAARDDAPKGWTHEKSPHQLLGVNKGETDIAKLESARRKAALKYHPDKAAHKSAAERAANEETMKAVNEAFSWMQGRAHSSHGQRTD